MSWIIRLLNLSGGVTLASGLIWAIVSMRYRNRVLDYESLLPEAFRDIESALALATVGGALLISGDILRRMRPQRRLAETEPASARLIDLPTNPLTGQMFGDLSRLFVDLTALALKDGEFHRASSDDTHGMY